MASLQQYSRTLVRKLERRSLQLEESNRALQRDIAERTRIEESLRLLSSAVLQAHESVTITDANLTPPGPRILFVNPAFSTMTGYAELEVVGKPLQLLHGARTDASVIGRMNDTLARGEVFDGEAIYCRKDGTEYIQEWQIAPIRNTVGVVTHFVAIQRDITERRRNQERIARLSRVRAVIGGISSAMLRLHDRDELLREACRVAATEGVFPLAWVTVPNPETQQFDIVAHEGVEPQASAIVELARRGSLLGDDRPSVRAAREKRPVIIHG
ncbi:PAS domain S-box protein, partial [Paucibacter sp. O1-1]|nr:PAS domain S-box protein [Paucibacter sp. O1-1]MDA3830011.1 PAS domain S-box protein [Paucibacter sp. O1-1]